jgi:hypothetical protein
MFIKKVSPALFRALGIFLPLITTNCAVLALALFQTNRGYGLVQCLVFALGAGAGFTLALVLMAGLRERLELAEVPGILRGTALALVLAGLLSIAFMASGWGVMAPPPDGVAVRRAPARLVAAARVRAFDADGATPTPWRGGRPAPGWLAPRSASGGRARPMVLARRIATARPRTTT